MRSLLILFLFGLGLNTYAQDSIKVKTPRIIMQKKLNQSMVYEDVAIKLINVLEDSRCPTDVNCLRAGEVKALIEITEAGKIRKLKQIILPANPYGTLSEKIYSTKDKLILAVNILPYPKTKVKTDLKDYSLQVEVRKY